MAKKISPEIIEQMRNLYQKFGTYSAVAKELGVAASTVSKYLKEKPIPVTTVHTEYNGPEPCVHPTREEVESYAILTKEEYDSLNKWMEEY